MPFLLQVQYNIVYSMMSLSFPIGEMVFETPILKGARSPLWGCCDEIVNPLDYALRARLSFLILEQLSC